MSYHTFLEAKLDHLFKPLDKDELPSSWHKNSDGSYDVDGDLDFYNQGLDELPYKFNNVYGDFYCNHNFLTSLEGSPKYVKGGFWCGFNRLTTLKGGPKIVDGDFNCEYNLKLVNLEGAPEEVRGNFWCHNDMKNFTVDDIKKVCDVKGKISI